MASLSIGAAAMPWRVRVSSGFCVMPRNRVSGPSRRTRFDMNASWIAASPRLPPPHGLMKAIFTEPSAEMDVQCRLCAGRGCSACKGTGWMEILGSGMVHPKVLEAAGIDSERYTGWAFGMGPARIAMQRYDLPDIRLLYDSDVRFLEQVAE